jgi:two-component system sensor histidine kinase BaeS
MLGNLVDNAIRYTRDGDSITVSLDTSNGHAFLEVADTGIGIEPEHLPHVLDRFYRADKARTRRSGGTGLGLAIVREIAEEHHGTVTVSSQPGKGSRFTVQLPLSSQT